MLDNTSNYAIVIDSRVYGGNERVATIMKIKRRHFHTDIINEKAEEWIKFIKAVEFFCNNNDIISISEHCVDKIYSIVVWYKQYGPN